MIRGSMPIRNGWIEGDHGFTGASWFWPREPQAPRAAVLLVPSIAHEERTLCGCVVALGHALADAGLASLLIDLTGTLQSNGDLDTADLGSHWRADIRRGVQHLRQAGFEHVIVIGMRVGALLALDALADESVLGIVSWAPILSGRRFVRELKVLQGTSMVGATAASEQICIAGFDLGANLLAHLSSLDTARLARLPTQDLLVLDAPTTPLDKWVGQIEAQGVRVRRAEPAEPDAWLGQTDALPTLPFTDIGTVAAWCASLRDAQPHAGATVSQPGPLSTTISFDHRGERVRETVLDIKGLSGVLSEPGGRTVRGATLLALSTVGPGRSFAQFARDEASRGRRSVRLDLAGFGTSDRRVNPFGGEVYTLSGCVDVADAVNHLRCHGHDAIAMLGFCASAWSMIQAGPLPGVCAAMAINVALYVDPGHVADFSAGGPSTAPQWLRSLLGDPLSRRVIGKLRQIANARKLPVGWLEQFGRADADVLLAFSDHDPGEAYLRRQLGRVLRRQVNDGLLRIRSYPGLGHLLEQPNARAQAFADVSAFLQDLDRKLARASQPGKLPQSGLRASANEITAAAPTAASTSSISR